MLFISVPNPEVCDATGADRCTKAVHTNKVLISGMQDNELRIITCLPACINKKPSRIETAFWKNLLTNVIISVLRNLSLYPYVQ